MPVRPTQGLAAIMLLFMALASSTGAERAALPHPQEASPPSVLAERTAPGAVAAEPRRLSEEPLIARCSRAFLECAGKGRQAMDVCIVGIPACAGKTAEPCCPASCTRRYAALRREGRSHPEAVHAALFPEPGRSCAAFP